MEHNMKILRSKATVGGCTLSFALLLLVLLVGSISGETVRNRRKQIEHERTDRRSMRSEGDGDLRPGGDGRWSVAVPLCAEDEYMDVNVQACSRCSEVCRPNIDLGFCASKCPEYFRIHFDSSNHPEVRHSSSLVTIISSPGGGREELLTEKPLFWTSIVSMTIAAAATTAIIVLCIRRRKPRGSLGGSVEPGENSRERTLSETSDDKDPEHRTLLRSTSGRQSEWNSSCRDERINVEELSNRSMYTTGGGVGGPSTTDRFGSAICNQNDHSNLSAMPRSPDRDRQLQKVLQTHFTHSNHILGINSTTFCQDPAKDNIWTSQKQIGNERSPSFCMHAEFLAENEKQLQTASGTLSTRPNAYSQETSYESLMHEVSRKREESLPYFQQEDETCVKENRFIDLQVPTRLPMEGDFWMEPKAMGILVNNGNFSDDITKLQVSVRMTTKGDSLPADHCAKAKATLYNSHPACCDGITTGIDEPN